MIQSPFRLLLFFAAFPVAASICTPTAWAIVAADGANNSAPPNDPGFANVGNANGSSAIYLADGWVLTAQHVAGALADAGNATVNFGGTIHSQDASVTPVDLVNSDAGFESAADLVLFKLATTPSLPNLQLAATAPQVGDQVLMIGRGRDQQATQTCYDRTISPGDDDDVWTQTADAGLIDICGFQTDDSNTISWGINEISSVGPADVNDNSTLDLHAFKTTFDDFTDEGQAVRNDSGGAVFRGDRLIGLMESVEQFENQPNGTDSALFGNETIMADLFAYRSQIASVVPAVVPEPSAIMLFLLSVPAIGWLRRGATIRGR